MSERGYQISDCCFSSHSFDLSYTIKSQWERIIEEAQLDRGQEDLKHIQVSRIIIFSLVLQCQGMFYHSITFYWSLWSAIISHLWKLCCAYSVSHENAFCTSPISQRSTSPLQFAGMTYRFILKFEIHINELMNIWWILAWQAIYILKNTSVFVVSSTVWFMRYMLLNLYMHDMNHLWIYITVKQQLAKQRKYLNKLIKKWTQSFSYGACMVTGWSGKD